MKPETATMHRLMLGASRSGWRLLRNNVGLAYMGAAVIVRETTMLPAREGDVLVCQARRVRFGVGGAGGPDLIGVKPLVIGPEHVGMTLGQFVAVEVKTGKGRTSVEQQQFLQAVRNMGGIGVVARTLADLPGYDGEPL